MITFTEQYRAKFAQQVMVEGVLIKRIPKFDLGAVLALIAKEGSSMGRILRVVCRHDSACPSSGDGSFEGLRRCLCERLDVVVSKGITLASLSKES